MLNCFIGTYDKDGSTIGWAVTFNNSKHGDSKSTCVWTGERQLDDTKPVILTTWLLTMQTDPKNNWESTMVGHDIFSWTTLQDEKPKEHDEQSSAK